MKQVYSWPVCVDSNRNEAGWTGSAPVLTRMANSSEKARRPVPTPVYKVMQAIFCEITELGMSEKRYNEMPHSTSL